MARARLRARRATGCCTASSWSRSQLSPRRSWAWRRALRPDRPRATIAVLSLILMAFAPAAWAQIAVIVLGAARRACCLPAGRGHRWRRGRRRRSRGGWGSFSPALFFALLALSFVPARLRRGRRWPPRSTAPGRWCSAAGMWCCRCFGPPWSIRAGSPTALSLRATAPPRPCRGRLFTFAAYLGAVASAPPGGVAGAALALVAIFAPGLLLLMGALPSGTACAFGRRARAAMAGVNAAVVGLLASALYNPVWTSAVGAGGLRHRRGGLCGADRLARAAAAGGRPDSRRGGGAQPRRLRDAALETTAPIAESALSRQ